MNNFQLQDQGEFKCSLCTSRFTRKWNLRKHERKVHSGDMSHICSLCSAKFNKYSYLSYHIQRYHSDTALNFQVNGQISNSSEIKETKPIMKYADERRHEPSSYSQRSKPTIRNKFYLKSLKGKFKCTFCPKRSTQKINVLNHEKKVHSGDTPHICSICSSAFNSDRFLKFHIMYHHRNTDPYSDIIAAKSNESVTKKYSKSSKLAVQKEKDSNNLQQSIVNEKSGHDCNENNPLHCSKCDKTFSSIKWLATHNKRFHSKRTKLSTSVAKKYHERFELADQKDSNNLQHLTIVNEKSGENSSENYQLNCPECNKSFSSINWLATHKMRCHSSNFSVNRKNGERCKCSFCDALFTMENNRNRHEKKFHYQKWIGKNSTKSHKRVTHRRCEPVSKASQMNTPPTPRSRARICTPGGVEMIYANELTCSYCPKFFSNRFSKELHEKIHTGDWTYQCRYCFMLFRLQNLLVAHEKKCLTLADSIWCQFCDFNSKSQFEVDSHHLRHGLDVNQSEILVPEENNGDIEPDFVDCKEEFSEDKSKIELDNFDPITHEFDANDSETLPEKSDGNLELSSFIDISKDELSSEDEDIPDDQENNHWSQFILISDDDD